MMEIDLPGIGIVRNLSDEELVRLRRHRTRPDGLIHLLAAMSGRSVKAYKKLPPEDQRAIVRAYLTLTSPARF